MSRQPGYYSSEDTPDAAFFLECGFNDCGDYLFTAYRYGHVMAEVEDGMCRVYLIGKNKAYVCQVLPKRDDGYVDCQDIMDLLLLLGVPCSVELH